MKVAQTIPEWIPEWACGHHDVMVSTMLKLEAPVIVWRVDLICKECGERFTGTVAKQ